MPEKLGPKEPPLDVSAIQLLTVLKRKPGRPYTVVEILTVLKEDPDIFDNRAAVIWIATKLEESKKVETAWVGEGRDAVHGWFVPKPKEPAAPAH